MFAQYNSVKLQRKKVTKKMELCLLKEKTKLEDARVLNSNTERERERESNAMQNERGN